MGNAPVTVAPPPVPTVRVRSGGPAPHVRGGQSHRQIIRSWLLAAGAAATAGTVLYGTDALRIVAVAVLAAAVCDAAMGLMTGRGVGGGTLHGVLTGALFALTLPPTVPNIVPAVGSAAAILLAKWMFGGLGHYLWHPAIVARIVVQALFASEFSFAHQPAAPVLAPGALLTGNLAAAETIADGPYLGWRRTPLPRTAEALRTARPVHWLRRAADGDAAFFPAVSGTARGDEVAGNDDLLTGLIRDRLPPWSDTLWGVVPGGLGETCTIVLILAGLYLVYRGHLPWEVPVFVLASAGLAATALPIAAVGTGGELTRIAWPGLRGEAGLAVGPLYVLYHLTSGQLMLGAFLLAGDMLATPLRRRGRIVFAAGVGLLTIVMRLYGIVEAECYWSILIMNSTVPFIDRWSRTAAPGKRAVGTTWKTFSASPRR